MFPFGFQIWFAEPYLSRERSLPGAILMDIQALVSAIRRSGGGQNAIAEAGGLLIRINVLEGTGRYVRLLSQLTRANDRSNFLALALEVNFAYQFESRGRSLTYEVTQNERVGGSIDFFRSLLAISCSLSYGCCSRRGTLPTISARNWSSTPLTQWL
jgi:hypothetical protein